MLLCIQVWTVTLSPDERSEIGPVDALRLDICEGNNTAFYGLNVDGWMLYDGVERSAVDSFDDE